MDFPCIQVTYFQEKTDGMTMIFLRQGEVRQLPDPSADGWGLQHVDRSDAQIKIKTSQP